MRNAKVKDVWRKLQRKAFTHRVDRIAFENIQGVGSGGIGFAGSITAICGANGAGKTTLLNALGAAIAKDARQVSAQVRRKLVASAVVSTIAKPGEMLSRSFRASDAPG